MLARCGVLRYGARWCLPSRNGAEGCTLSASFASAQSPAKNKQTADTTPATPRPTSKLKVESQQKKKKHVEEEEKAPPPPPPLPPKAPISTPTMHQVLQKAVQHAVQARLLAQQAKALEKAQHTITHQIATPSATTTTITAKSTKPLKTQLTASPPPEIPLVPLQNSTPPDSKLPLSRRKKKQQIAVEEISPLPEIPLVPLQNPAPSNDSTLPLSKRKKKQQIAVTLPEIPLVPLQNSAPPNDSTLPLSRRKKKQQIVVEERIPLPEPLQNSTPSSEKSPLPEILLVPFHKPTPPAKRKKKQIAAEEISPLPEIPLAPLQNSAPSNDSTLPLPKHKKKQQIVVEEITPLPDIPLVPLQKPKPKANNKKPKQPIDSNNEQSALPITASKWSPREWVKYVTKKREEWKQLKKAQSLSSTSEPMMTKKPKPPGAVRVKQAAPPPFDVESLNLSPSHDDDMWAKSMQKFASSVSWIQFRDFLVQFHKSKWQDNVLTSPNKLKHFAMRCWNLFDPEDARALIECIGPHLHRLTPQILYEARKTSIEGIPLLGKTPYLAAFVTNPVSCPCVRIPVTGEPKCEEAPVSTGVAKCALTGCQCYQLSNLEVFDHSPETIEHVQQRVCTLTKTLPKVFVENLHPEIGVKELLKMFCKIGQVQAVEIFRERLSGEGAETLETLLAPDEEIQQSSKKRPPLKRQVTGQSPVYAWVYFSDKRGEQRALHPVIRLLGVNFLKHESRTHPASERKTLYLGNLPLIPIGGLESYVVSLLTNGQHPSNSNLVQLLNPPTQYEYKKDVVVKESARQGFCLAEFVDHASALSAYHKLARLSLPQEGSSKLPRVLRVGWHVTDPSLRHETAKHESTKALRARPEPFFPVQQGDPFVPETLEEQRINGHSPFYVLPST